MNLNDFFELVGRDPIKVPPPITVRPIKPSFMGPCKVCGERRHFCDCDNGEGE